MTIIADSSSLILLSKVSVVEIFVKRNRVFASRLVYEEVVRGKEKGREDSMRVEKLVQERLLKIRAPEQSIKVKIEKLFNLKKGELEVISLSYKTRHTVLTDDKKGLNAAKALDINFITSLDVIAALFKRGAINRKKARDSMDGLEEHGWYAKDLVKSYRELIKC